MKKRSLRIVTSCLAGALLFATPIYVEAAPVAGVTEYAGTIIDNELNTASPIAGVSLAVSTCLEQNVAEQARSAQKQSDSAEKKEKSKEESSKYKNMAVANVDDYVNIRKSPNEDGKLLGKLHRKSVANVIKKKGDWYQIKSGSVTGYVKGDYITVGDEDKIKAAGVPIATVSTTTLKVRSKASGKSGVVTLVPGGEALKVTSMKNEKDGWVKVAVDGGSGYVSSDYIELTREYTYAESKAEEDARIALEQARLEEERAAKEAAAKQAEEEAQDQAGESAASTASTSASNSTTSASTSNSTVASTGTATNAGTVASSGTTTNSGTTTTPTQQAPTQTAPSVQAPEPAQTQAPAENSSSASATGQAVANYASQFVGNPYVWGGTSLTNGADCSGFVLSVYAHFGVSLPHSDAAQRSAGRAVSWEDRQPGDIICYDGHVGIYAGNNTIIHASNPASGIKYTSPANYRTVLAVRRIF